MDRSDRPEREHDQGLGGGGLRPRDTGFEAETTGNDPGTTGQGRASLRGRPGPVSEKRYTVRFDVGPNGARCSQPRGRSCRCLKAETLAGGCSQATATKGGRNGAWIVTVSGQGAQVIEGFSTCGSGAKCFPGSPTSANAMMFLPRGGRSHHTRRAISHIELTFSVPTPNP